MPDSAAFFYFTHPSQWVYGMNDPLVRAENTLRAHLSPEQLADYLRTRTFRARGNFTKRVYTIVPRWSNNVYHIEHSYMPYEQHVAQAFCTGSDANVPMADHMLIQKLYIETNEFEFLKIACASGRGLVPPHFPGEFHG